MTSLPQKPQLPVTWPLKAALINPFFMRSLPCTYRITDAYQLDLTGQKLTSDQPLRVGEVVRISLGVRTFELTYVSELEAYKQAMDAYLLRQKALDEQSVADKWVARQQASQAFYERYAIPFTYSIEIKEVLSGLSAHSNGDGWRRNTVFHVYTLERIDEKKRERDPFTFLCSPASAKSGGNWSASLGQDTHKQEDQYRPIPTCKQCLLMLERYLVTKPRTSLEIPVSQ